MCHYLCSWLWNRISVVFCGPTWNNRGSKKGKRGLIQKKHSITPPEDSEILHQDIFLQHGQGRARKAKHSTVAFLGYINAFCICRYFNSWAQMCLLLSCWDGSLPLDPTFRHLLIKIHLVKKSPQILWCFHPFPTERPLFRAAASTCPLPCSSGGANALARFPPFRELKPKAKVEQEWRPLDGGITLSCLSDGDLLTDESHWTLLPFQRQSSSGHMQVHFQAPELQALDMGWRVSLSSTSWGHVYGWFLKLFCCWQGYLLGRVHCWQWWCQEIQFSAHNEWSLSLAYNVYWQELL